MVIKLTNDRNNYQPTFGILQEIYSTLKCFLTDTLVIDRADAYKTYKISSDTGKALSFRGSLAQTD